MDPGFYADPDPDYKNPDPFVFCFNKLMESKWCSLIRFWRNLTKKDSVQRTKYDIQIFFTYTYSFWAFFSWIWIRIFQYRIQIFGRSRSGRRKKKSDLNPDKRTRIRNTGLINCSKKWGEGCDWWHDILPPGRGSSDSSSTGLIPAPNHPHIN